MKLHTVHAIELVAASTVYPKPNFLNLYVWHLLGYAYALTTQQNTVNERRHLL
jgi:hypothetical protein